MTTILPSARSPWHVIDQAIGQQISQNLPGAVQQGFQRQTGLNAIDQLQQDLAQSGGDINKMLPALARAYTLNPNLERSGIGQTFLQQAKVGRAFPETGQGGGQQGNALPEQISLGSLKQPSTQQGTFAAPGPFNIMSQPEMDAEAKRYAAAVQDPNAYNSRFNQLQAQNETATSQRNMLEDAALKAHVPPSELPRFMVVNNDLDFRNPSEWAQDAKRNYAKVKSNDDKLEKAFIPDTGNALLGQNRDSALKRLAPTVQDQISRGLEQETRNFLADKYLSPTEIEELIHPITPQKEKAIKSFPKGSFPAETAEQLSYFAPSKDFKSYEEELEKNPQALQKQQNQLADFFLKNVDNDTSLLVLRDKLWKDKDYDWRQIGPAIREAESKGLKLNTQQSTEMTDIETQAPYESLPEIFQSWDRFKKFIRGNQ